MDGRRMIYTVLLFGFVLPCCAPSITVRRAIPAKYNISGIKRIAVVPFTYVATYHEEGSVQIPKVIESALYEDNFFEVVEPPLLPNPVMDAQISSDIIRELGRASGADAVITGKVMAFQVGRTEDEVAVEKEVETGEYRIEEYEENGIKKYRKIPVTKRVIEYEPLLLKEADVSFYIDLISARDAKILNHIYYSKLGEEKAQGEDNIEKLASDGDMLENILGALSAQVLRDLIPHEVSERLSFKNDKPCRDGIKAAKKGRWKDAINSWNEILAADDISHCAVYNLGLAYEVKQDYVKARTYYDEVEKTGMAHDKLYSQARFRITTKIRDKEMLVGQMEGRR